VTDIHQAKILVGDVLERIKEIPDESIQSAITSPPYWGLRDYGHDEQIGLEESPEAYVANMVDVFREVRRILKDDGVLWLNLGDSYAGNNSRASNNGRAGYGNPREGVFARTGEGLKPKDLVGIPWRVAFALQADGWWLRQDIIWHKPNPMPESVTDRCTKAHEYLFMLTKNSRYYFDNEAIKEPSADLGKTEIRFGGAKYGDSDDPKHQTKSGNTYTDKGTKNKRSVWTVAPKPFRGAHFAVMPEALVEPCVLASTRPEDTTFDPFTGSGTVGVVSLRHQRHFIGTELNPDYATIAEERIKDSIGLLGEVVVSQTPEYEMD
jgi:DNA modification methylase